VQVTIKFEYVFDRIQRLLLMLFRKRELQTANIYPIVTEVQWPGLWFEQDFPVQFSGEGLWKNETHLRICKQPADMAVFARNAVMLAERLTPAPEIGGIALWFTFEHHCVNDPRIDL